MLRLLAASLAVFIIGLLQSTVGRHLSISGVPPDLPLLLTVSLALVAGPIPALVAAFALSLLQAGLAQRDLLAYALSLLLPAFLAGETGRRFFPEHWLVPVLSLLLLTPLADLLFSLASSTPVHPLRWFVLRPAYNAALALPCLRLLARAQALLSSRPAGR
jgi:hypothetical protein